MECFAVRHVSFEDLGVWEDEIRAHGYTITYADAGVDDLTPLATTDLAVVLGGPIGVEDIDRYPVLREEIDLLERRLAQDLPTIGVCLGAQLLAAAAGAKVYQGAREIGWDAVELTDAGRTGPLAHLDDLPMLHWHRDTFDLPEGAELLASTPETPHQAFTLGRALGIQFHPEVDTSHIERWLIGHSGQLMDAGIDVPELRAHSRELGDQMAMAGVALIRAWLRAQD
ncbi:MAG: glutamine amidotransferase [Actinobacteria bacterium HGW-Actinobacteria-4]|nr:MAG: glutamine amidotransferase [Actinobacteria bacterium HGW-Actinobacteria-4]